MLVIPSHHQQQVSRLRQRDEFDAEMAVCWCILPGTTIMKEGAETAE